MMKAKFLVKRLFKMTLLFNLMLIKTQYSVLTLCPVSHITCSLVEIAMIKLMYGK